MIRMLFIVLVTFIVPSTLFASQSNTDLITGNNITHQIEDYILANQNDSALFLLAGFDANDYLLSLTRISKGNATYADFQKIISSFENRTEILYSNVSDFIEEWVEEPENTKAIDLDYVTIIWGQVSKLRDEVTIEEASRIQSKLDEYINKFDAQNDDVKRAKILSSTHQIVLSVIQKEIEKGKKLCLDNLKISEQLNDKRLMIVSLYYLCDFIIFEGKLDEYITTCEKSLEIENTLKTKSSYYSGTLIHIIDAYIYKGGNQEKIEALLSELYNFPNARAQSYSLYAKYLGVIDLSSKSAQNIFTQFEVSTLPAFCQKVEVLGEERLNPNDFYQLLREMANTLQIQGFLNEAIAVKDRTVVEIKKIYSQDLANSLASYKTSQAVKEKDLQIEYQSKRNQLYLIIASLIAVLLLITILAFWRKRKQSKVLEVKNQLINKALKEKELLVREVHHRVKNNFQIVSSLLELQTRGIEDKKARMLANEGQNRVKSMALIHQKLYQNDDGLIDFDEYVNLLVRELTSMFASDLEIETKVNADNMHFDIDTAIPLGLIVNELITNAYKYAFTTEKRGELKISIDRVDNENFKLIVSDNGLGLPDDFDLKKVKSLGIRLVTRLVKQLQGTISLTNNSGARFEIIFKDIHARKKMNE